MSLKMFHLLAVLDSMAAGLDPVRFGRARKDSLSVFAENELQQVFAKTYDKKYPALDALKYFGVIPGINAWAQQFAVDSYSQFGRADWYAPGARDVLRADVFKTRNGFPIAQSALAYGYELDEMMSAQLVGIPLDQKRADACRRGIEEFRNTVILSGDTAKGLPGVLTNAAVPLMTVPTGDWLGASTPDQILTDMNAIVAAVYNNTNRVHNATQLLIPNPHYKRLEQRVYAPGISPASILAVFRANNPGVSVDPLTELATAGPSSAPRAIAYEKSTDNVGAVVPMMFNQMPPDVLRGGLETIVYCIERLGGGVWFYPMSGVIADGIGAIP